jgi:hypothetical protein
MSDFGLNTQQLAAICALSSGAGIAAAAEQAGVHRNTINNWRRNSPPFQLGFAHAQYDRALYFREKAEGLIDLAFQAVQEILTDPNTPPSVRLKAALAIIAAASTPPPPEKRVELDIEKMVFKKSPAETVTEDQLAPAPPAPVHNNAQPVQPAAPPSQAQNVHNSAQPSSPKVGRNAACPCGSGKKYKRCCQNMQVSKEFVQRLASAA